MSVVPYVKKLSGYSIKTYNRWVTYRNGTWTTTGSERNAAVFSNMSVAMKVFQSLKLTEDDAALDRVTVDVHDFFQEVVDV